jgi:hypothetical protein
MGKRTTVQHVATAVRRARPRPKISFAMLCQDEGTDEGALSLALRGRETLCRVVTTASGPPGQGPPTKTGNVKGAGISKGANRSKIRYIPSLETSTQNVTLYY